MFTQAFYSMFGSKRRTIKRGKYKGETWITLQRYPREIINGSPESLCGTWWYENLPQRGLSGGSKLRAYIRARCFAIQAKAYTTASQVRTSYVMFACPKGILP